METPENSGPQHDASSLFSDSTDGTDSRQPSAFLCFNDEQLWEKAQHFRLSGLHLPEVEMNSETMYMLFAILGRWLYLHLDLLSYSRPDATEIHKICKLLRVTDNGCISIAYLKSDTCCADALIQCFVRQPILVSHVFQDWTSAWDELTGTFNSPGVEQLVPLSVVRSVVDRHDRNIVRYQDTSFKIRLKDGTSINFPDEFHYGTNRHLRDQFDDRIKGSESIRTLFGIFYGSLPDFKFDYQARRPMHVSSDYSQLIRSCLYVMEDNIEVFSNGFALLRFLGRGFNNELRGYRRGGINYAPLELSFAGMF